VELEVKSLENPRRSMQESPSPVDTTCRIVGIWPNGNRELLDEGMSQNLAVELFMALMDSGRFVALRLERDAESLPGGGRAQPPP